MFEYSPRYNILSRMCINRYKMQKSFHRLATIADWQIVNRMINHIFSMKIKFNQLRKKKDNTTNR